MERGSRMLTCLQLVEKVLQQKARTGYGQDELQTLRYNTAKISQLTATQEKAHRDLILKNPDYVDLLLSTLQCANDATVELNVVHTFNELLGKTHISKRASCLVSQGATHVLLQTLVYQAKDANPNEDLLVAIHQVLSKIAPKDRKFGVKARLNQALSVTLTLVKNYSGNPKVVTPIVHVLKLYSANAVNASFLGKNGAVSHLFRVLVACQKKHLTLIKYSLDALAQLVKSKSNSARAIGHGGVPILLNMFQEWQRMDSKNRHIQLRKSILNVLKFITNLKSGGRALMEADGIRILYTACQESLDIRELESLIFMASLVMRKCFPKNRLPLPTLRSPLHFPIPTSDFHVVDAGEGHDNNGPPSATTPISDHVSSASSTTNGKGCDENGYESSIDNDDDLSSDDDPDGRHKVAESDEDGDGDLGSEVPYQRTTEELKQYTTFFPEIQDLEELMEEYTRQEKLVTIPTGSYDHLGSSGGSQQSTSSSFRTTQSASTLQQLPRLPGGSGQLPSSETLRSSRHSLPNFNMGSGEDLGLRELRLGPPDDEMFSVQRTRLKGGLSSKNSSPNDSTSDMAAAVNLKTGAPVFSLDLNSSVNRKQLHQKSPKAKRRGSKSGKLEKKRLSKSRVGNGKQDDWLSESNGSVSGTSTLNGATPSSATAMALNGSTPLQSLIREQPLGIDNDANSDENDDDQTPEMDDEYNNKFESAEIYADIAAKTRSAGRFNKIAYPDMHGHSWPPYREQLYEKRFGTQRQKIFEDIDRFINPEHIIDQVVYDLDTIVHTAGPTYTSAYSNFTNRDEIRVTRKDDTNENLRFNSQFECGNLRKAIQVRKYEYDLILSPDVNTNHHHQWFYFEVSNMEANVNYRFNIVNCEKLNSQFNFGMKPVLYSVSEAVLGRPHWLRSGTEICYYKNHFVRSAQTTGGVRGKSYYTATFSIAFKHEKDVCYVAYHYPYTYSMLMAHLYKWENTCDMNDIYFRNQCLTHSLGGNPVPLLTITSHPQSYDKDGLEQFKNRPYIFLSSRVHPGESNSSWVMRGTINFLLSDKPAARALRDMYVFKVVPMLNPDGVINGNHRCSLVAEDLNRRWLRPCPKVHPTIYHTKGLLHYLHMINKVPLVFCDYHGHSRRKNVFLYGCSPSLSWMTEDLDNPAIIQGNKVEDTSYKNLPRLLQQSAPAFSLASCSFMVEKSKETTARVVVWRQIGIVRSYTMESSYCGCDQGPYRGFHISTRELEEMGRKFCEALSKIKSRRAGIKGGATAAIQDAQALGLLDRNLVPDLKATRLPSPVLGSSSSIGADSLRGSCVSRTPRYRSNQVASSSAMSQQASCSVAARSEEAQAAAAAVAAAAADDDLSCSSSCDEDDDDDDDDDCEEEEEIDEEYMNEE